MLALIVAMLVALFAGVKLFRWEKEEKIATSAKLWILVVLAPFFVMGIYQFQTKQNIEKSKLLQRTANRRFGFTAPERALVVARQAPEALSSKIRSHSA